MSLLHQRLNDLFEARRKKPQKAQGQLFGRAPGNPKKKKKKRSKQKLVTKADINKGIRELDNIDKRLAKTAKGALLKAQKLAMKDAKKANNVAFADTIAALGDGRVLIDAAKFLDKRTPDFTEAKPYLGRIYKAFLPFLESHARMMATKRKAGVQRSRGSAPPGWKDVGSIPPRAAKMAQASVWGPEASDAKAAQRRKELMKSLNDAAAKGLGDFAADAKGIVAKHHRAVKHHEKAVSEAGKEFTKAVKEGSPEKEVLISKDTYMTMAQIKDLKKRASGIQRGITKAKKEAKTDEDWGFGPSLLRKNTMLATVELARVGYIKARTKVQAAYKVLVRTRSLYNQIEFNMIVGGNEGLILPHEVANEFFVNMGISIRGKTAGKPKSGFYNLIIVWGNTLNPQNSAWYQKSATVKSAVSAIGSAFAKFASNVIRDGAFKGGSKLKFVDMPLGDEAYDAPSREGVDAWNASRESLKGSLKDFFKGLTDDLRLVRGQQRGMDLKRDAQKLIDKGGAERLIAKNIRGYAKEKTVSYVKQGKQKFLQIILPTTDRDLKLAAKGKVPTVNEAQAQADASNRVSLATKLFGPVTHPLMRYDQFFSSESSYIQNKEGSKVGAKKPAMRSLLDKRPRITNWANIIAKVNIFAVGRVKIGSAVMGKVVKVDGDEAKKIAMRIVGTSKGRAGGQTGLWTDMSEFMFDQKAVKKIAKSRFAPERGRGVWGRSGIDDPMGRIDVNAKRVDKAALEKARQDKLLLKARDDERRRQKSRGWDTKDHKNVIDLQNKARRMKSANAERYAKGESPSPAFKAFAKEAAKELGMTVAKTSAAAKLAFDTFGKSQRDKIANMNTTEFEDYLKGLSAKKQDAAKVVRVGIKGPGLTERRRSENTVMEAAPRRQTKCVRRLRECFA